MTGPVQLFLRISAGYYRVEPMACPPGARPRFFGLVKRDGTRYQASENERGELACTCADFTFRGSPGRYLCKHLRALCTFGLFLFPPDEPPEKVVGCEHQSDA